MTGLVTLVGIAALVGCYAPVPVEGFPCGDGPDPRCPEGLSCAPDGLCRVEAARSDASASADGSTPVVDAAAVDATQPPVDAAIAPNVAFVSSTQALGFGSVAAADTMCQDLAVAAGVPGTFMALLGSSAQQDPTARAGIADSRGWVDLAGYPIIENPADWVSSGALLNPLRRDQNGVEVGDVYALNGTDNGHCADWTLTTGGSVTLWRVGSSMRSRFYSSCAFLARLVCLEVGRVATLDITEPAGRYAFITAATWAVSGGRAAADAVCQGDATAASLPGTYLAALPLMPGSGLARFSVGLPWKRPDGVRVAPTASDLLSGTGFLESFINRTATGVLANNSVWTASGGANDCTGWTSTTGITNHGESSESSSVRVFSGGGPANCSGTHRLLCLQE